MHSVKEMPGMDSWLVEQLTKDKHVSANNNAAPDAFMSEGHRNIDLTKIAGYMRRCFNSDEPALFKALSGLNQSQSVPLDTSEIRTIARSIANRSGGTPPALQDVPLARYVAENLSGKCSYVSEWGWMTYAASAWKVDMSGVRTKEHVARTLETYVEVCKESGDPDLIKSARTILSGKKINAIVTIMAGDPHTTADAEVFDADSNLLNLKNGTLDLTTGVLRDHDPRDRLTKTANVTFDQTALCPNFDKLLLDALPRDVGEFVLRLLGYTLLGNPTEQVFSIFHGMGANGKSTLLNAASFLLGDYAANVEPSSFMRQKNDKIRDDLARTKGVRIVGTSELAIGEILDAALMKRITGGDNITARALYGRLFEFIPQFAVFMITNALPVIDGSDTAIARRIMTVHFKNTVPDDQRDRLLPEKLKSEASGILNRLLEGLKDYREKDDLAAPESVRVDSANYVKNSDMLREFLEDECELIAGSQVGAKDFYDSYSGWCIMRGLRTLSMPQFKAAMIRKLGFEPKKTKAGAVWPGLQRRKPIR